MHTIAFLIFMFVIPLAPSHASATVKADHPRIWMTDARKTTLVNRLNRNTAQAQSLRNWCDNNMSEDLSRYSESRAVPALNAINYALMYQLTGNAAYGNRAIAIVEYLFGHPYSGYTIDTWISFDWYYTDRYLVPPVAIVLDWCWDIMSTDQRNTFISQLDRWAASMMTGDPWAWNEPSGNYFFGHTWALLTIAYAIYGHTATAQTYLDRALLMLGEGIKYAKGEETIWDFMGNYTGRAKGGLWNEGTSYGCVDNEFICASILAVRSAETDKQNYPASGFPFANEVIQYYINALQPSDHRTYIDGDGASSGELGATVRVPILLCTALADAPFIGYCKYWLDTQTSPATNDYKLYQEFMWYPDEATASDYRGIIDTHYLCEGTRVLFWRSGWGENDTWMAFRIGILNAGHAQNGLGHFTIFNRGYLVTDKAFETQNGQEIDDVDHNVLYIAPAEANKRLYWGASVINHYQVTSDYLYFAGDMSPIYNAQPDYRNNTVQHKDREFLLIKGEKVLAIMDRGTSFNMNVDKIWQMYFHNQAVASGSAYRSSNGNADVVVKTAYPSTAQAFFDVYGAPRMRVTTPEAAASKQFLHLLKVTSPGGAFQTTPVTVSGAAVAAGAFSASTDALDYLIAFSADPSGTPPATTYNLTFTRLHSEIAGYIANLSPNTVYYIGGSTAGATGTVTVSRTMISGAVAHQSDADGFIFCKVNLGEAEQPPPPPHPVGID
jgi:hypothetical protein